MTAPNEQEDWFYNEGDPVPNGRTADPVPNGRTADPVPPRRDRDRFAEPPAGRAEPTTRNQAQAPVNGAPIAEPADTARYDPPEDTTPPRPNVFVDEPEPRTYEPLVQPAPAHNPWDETDAGDGDDGLEPLAIPTNANVSQNAMQIGMWGQPEAGKTTYLGALRIAAAERNGNLGSWTVAGLDDPSSDFLVARAREMTRLRKFPDATVGVETLRWSFNGRLPGRFLLRRPVEFVLSVQDMTGEAFRQGLVMQRVVDHLARSRGLIYLFDPITLNTANIDFFDQTLQMLSAAVGSAGRLHKGRLPQYLSVCVTKFDDPAFFRRAVRDGWVTQDSSEQRLPRVPDDRAEDFFDWVCGVLRRQGAPLIRNLIRSNFHDSRVRYFATSSIGFRLNQREVFDFRDFRNVDVAGDRQKRIRDMVRPINVLEPLISLERAIRG